MSDKLSDKSTDVNFVSAAAAVWGGSLFSTKINNESNDKNSLLSEDKLSVYIYTTSNWG